MKSVFPVSVGEGKVRISANNISPVEIAVLFFVTLFVAGAVLLGPARTGLSAVNEGADNAMVARGREIFRREQCFYCHTLGSAQSPPANVGPGLIRRGPDLSVTPLRTDDWHLAHLLDPRAVRPLCPMPAFASLSDADLRALVVFLQSLSPAAPPPTPSPQATEPIPRVPKDLSTYRAGRRLYVAYCQGCHGGEGNGTGPVGPVQAPEPRDFTNAAWMSKQTDRYLFSVISGGKPHTAMPGYADLLTPLQRALLVQYVRYFADPAERQRLEEGLPPPP